MNIEIALLIQIGYIIYNYWKKDKINNWSLCLHKKVLKYSFCD